MKIIKVLYEVMAVVMLALTALVAVLGINRIAGLTLEGISGNAWLLIPLAVAAVLFAALTLVQKRAEGKRAFFVLYLKAHLMAIASIVTIYLALVSLGTGAAAPMAVIACAIFMLIVAAVMWRITVKFKIWE